MAQTEHRVILVVLFDTFGSLISDSTLFLYTSTVKSVNITVESGGAVTSALIALTVPR